MAKKVSKSVSAGKPGNVGAASFMKTLMKNGGLASRGTEKDAFWSTGNVTLDRVLGGGIQKKSVTVFRGQAQSGKSLMSLVIARKAVDDGEKVVYLDTENKIPFSTLERMGFGDKVYDPEIDNQDAQLYFFTIDTQKNAIDAVLQMIESDEFSLVVIDSINGLYTEEQENRDIHEESKVGGYQAKTWSEWLPMLTQRAARHGCAIILTQQARDNLTSMYGPSETYSGGKAIEHFATTIIRLGSNKKDDEIVDGMRVRRGVTARVDKSNKGALPEAAIEMRYYIGDNPNLEWGVDELSGVFSESVRLGVLAPRKRGSSFYVPCKELCDRLDLDEKSLTFNGKARVLSALENDRVLFDAVKEIVIEVNNGTLVLAEPESELAVDFEELDEE